jgi:phospholipid/cholesterol/gamma-HCH transport system substrate-binding protein
VTAVRRFALRLLAVGIVLGLAGPLASCSGGGSMTLTATFDDVGDLVVGHAVQVADIRIGEVTGIELGDDFKATITMKVKDSVKIPRDASALLRTTSLLGEKFIELRVPEARGTSGPFLRDGDRIRKTGEAPELEFIAEQAVQVLGAVSSTDLATLIKTGAVGFGERGPEIKQLIGDLSTFTGALASRTGDITRIIDRLGEASTTLADGSGELDSLLLNLADTTTLLVDNRDRTLHALDELSRLARIQNTEVFEPYLADVQRQLVQVDAILRAVAGSSAEIEDVVDWLDQFSVNVPKGIPGDFAQIYLYTVPHELDQQGGGG